MLPDTIDASRKRLQVAVQAIFDAFKGITETEGIAETLVPVSNGIAVWPMPPPYLMAIEDDITRSLFRLNLVLDHCRRNLTAYDSAKAAGRAEDAREIARTLPYWMRDFWHHANCVALVIDRLQGLLISSPLTIEGLPGTGNPVETDDPA